MYGMGRYWAYRMAPSICEHCKGSGIECVYGGHGNINEEDCSMCDGTGYVRAEPLSWRDVSIFISIKIIAIGIVVMIAWLTGSL